MTIAPDSSIHRYLDAAFAGVPLTPDAQDLKEELRASLTARAAELVGPGVDSREASAKAIAELGDIRDAIGELGEAPAPLTKPSMFETMGRNRVKPKPLFVIRAIVIALVLAVAVVLLVLGGLLVVGLGFATQIVLVIVASLAVGLLVVDGTRQETSMTYALPLPRSVGFGLAAIAGGLSIGFLAIFISHFDAAWLLFAGGALFLIALIGFTWLGVTQTNRRKAWALELQRDQAAADRFTQDPVAAARFGMYTVVIWVLTFAAFAAASILVGFAWSWLTLVLGLVVFFLVLARMLFPAETKERH